MEGFDNAMYERMIAQDVEAMEEVEEPLETLKQTADKLGKLGKLAASAQMEQRLCCNHVFAQAEEARGALAQWHEVVEKKKALQDSMDAALACEQECFMLRSLLLEDHSPREAQRVSGVELNRVKERLPAIHTLYRELYESFDRFERAYLPLVEAIQADSLVANNSRFITRLMEYPEMEAKVKECYDEIVSSVELAEESVAKHEGSINRALLHRSRQRREYEEKQKTIVMCPVCGTVNDPNTINCITCGTLLLKLFSVCFLKRVLRIGCVF